MASVSSAIGSMQRKESHKVFARRCGEAAALWVDRSSGSAIGLPRRLGRDSSALPPFRALEFKRGRGMRQRCLSRRAPQILAALATPGI